MENGFDPKLPISTQIAVMHNTAPMWRAPWTSRCTRRRRGISGNRPDCMAGHVGLELANVHFGKVVEMLGKFSLDHPNILGPETLRARAATSSGFQIWADSD